MPASEQSSRRMTTSVWWQKRATAGPLSSRPACHRPDVAMLDVRMPYVDGIEAGRQIVAAGLPSRVLILTTFDLDEYVYGAIRNGASGFLLKDAPRDQLVAGVRAVAVGRRAPRTWCDRRLIERFARLPPPGVPRPEALGELHRTRAGRPPTDRSRVEQRRNRKPAGHQPYDRENPRSSILSKLRLRDRVQAVVLAYESGLVEPGDDGR